jgi:glycosyltransferase involved in cell wall biosynthesis
LPVVSIVFPVYSEESNLEPLYRCVREALSRVDAEYDMVFVDNGSTDSSLEIIKGLSRRDSRVRYISLARNFGHQAALFAGMGHATGDAVITMDADLQHPPSLIPTMVSLWQDGYDVVYTTKRNHKLPWLKRQQVKAFYWLISRLSGLRLSYGQSDFRLADRSVISALLEIPEYRKFLRGMVEWVGFKQVGLDYDVQDRHSGESKFSFVSLFSFAIDGILAFSALPLRLILAAGVVAALGALTYALAAIIMGLLSLFNPMFELPPGWATLAATITFFGGAQLIAIGAVGEYIARTYEQSKGRPVYIVRESSDGIVRKRPAADEDRSPLRWSGVSIEAADRYGAQAVGETERQARASAPGRDP